jgi:prepilin-type N-terminal cleavage/methylation domain-containing protein
MKKMTNKGFTLIELLAVITIMGILMMVAIPAVSRTIENSRRDTFADIAHEYINAVRNAMLADNIECYNPDCNSASCNEWRVASATNTGAYYFPICTSSDDCDQIDFKKLNSAGVEEGNVLVSLTKSSIQQSTADLMESGGKSPFGNAELQGYVLLKKAVTTTEAGDLKTSSKYYIVLGDTGYHGLPSPTQESEIKRSKVSMDLGENKPTNVLKTAQDIESSEIETNADGTPRLDENGRQIHKTVSVTPIPCRIS